MFFSILFAVIKDVCKYTNIVCFKFICWAFYYLRINILLIKTCKNSILEIISANSENCIKTNISVYENSDEISNVCDLVLKVIKSSQQICLFSFIFNFQCTCFCIIICLTT